MAVDALRVQVLFSAMDRLTGPLKSMGSGSQGLKASLAGTRKEILALEREQGRAGALKAAEANYRQLGDAVKVARLEAKAAKLELAAAEKPTAALAKAADRAAAAEAKAGAAYQAAGEKVQKLGNELEAAGVDITRLAQHEDRLASSVYDANKRLEQQTAALEKNQKAQARAQKVKAIGGKISSVGGAASLAVTLPFVALAKTAMDAANESSAATGQVSQALETMGAKSGRSIEQLQAQAKSLMNSSLFDDDDIMRKVTSNMLTFGNISGTVFDKAQLAAVNMSTALGQDLQSSTMQLGKALNDPLKGITALSKVGVSFSAQQKKQIEGFTKTGQAAKAQAIILGELDKQFGGRAARARKDDPNAAARMQAAEAMENAGNQLNKAMPKILAPLEKLLNLFNSMPDGMQQTVVMTLALAAAFGPLLMIIGPIVSGLGALRGAWLAWRAAQTASAAAGAASALSLGPLLIIVAVAAAIGVAAYLIYTHWDKIKAAFSVGVAAVMAYIERVKASWSSLKASFSAVLTFIGGLVSRFAAMGGQIISGLINGITGKLGALKSTIVNAAKNVAAWFKSKLGIQSPSRVFMGFGGHITDGLSRGIAAGEGAAIKRVDRLSTRVAGAFAATSLIATPAFASAPGAGASRMLAAPGNSGGQAASFNVTFHIQQAAGESGDDLARRVADELRKLQGASARSAYRDDD